MIALAIECSEQLLGGMFNKLLVFVLVAVRIQSPYTKTNDREKQEQRHRETESEWTRWTVEERKLSTHSHKMHSFKFEKYQFDFVYSADGAK